MPCTPQSSIAIGNKQNANNSANPPLNGVNSGGASEGSQRSASRVAQGQAQKQAARQAVNNTINQQPNPNPITSSNIRPQIRNMASNFQRSQAEAGMQRIADAWNEAIAWARNATVGTSNFLLNLTTNLTSKFVRSNAQLEKYFLVHAGSLGKQAINNKGVRDARLAQAKAVGKYRQWERALFRPFIKAVHPLAKQLGVTDREMAEMVGHYANWQHMPEGNAELLRRWDAEAQAADAAGDVNTAAALRQDIAALKQHLDNPNPVDSEGKRLAPSRGLTNGEAAAKMNEFFSKYRVEKAKMDELSQQLRDMYHAIQGDRIDNGFVDPKILDQFPDMNFYVPIRTSRDHVYGATNDANVYNPGKLKAMKGIRESEITDAYTTIERFAERAAVEASYRDLGFDLIAMQRNAARTGIDNGIRVYDYNMVTGMMNGTDAGARNWAFRMMNSDNGFAMVLDLPVQNADGSTGLSRKVITFDQGWRDSQRTGLDGIEMNRMFNLHERGSVGWNIAAKITSVQSQLYTRFNASFAPANAMRDVWERFTHLAGMSYELENGAMIGGHNMLLGYMANLPKVSAALIGMLDGSLDRAASPIGRYWQEYVRNGGYQQYTPGHDARQTELAKALTPNQRTFMQHLRADPKLEGFRQALAKVSDPNANVILKTIDSWNDYFNNIASFTHYVTLREAGVKESSAAAGMLSLMNLYETGEATPYLRAIFPFVKPTMQGAAAMLRTFGLAPDASGKFRPNLAGNAMFAAQVMAFSMLKPLLSAQMGEDEEGRSRYDAIPVADLARFMPLGTGDGNFIKLQLGFGPMQIASTLVNSVDRMQKGQMSPEDAFIETMVSAARNLQPADWPSFAMREHPFKWLASLMTPQPIRPIVENAMNIGYGGRTLTYADPNSSTPVHLQGRKSTEAEYHRMARFIFDKTGQDVAPEQVKHFVEGYLAGPMRIFTEFMKEDSLRAGGVDKTNAQILGPWLSSVGATIWHGKVSNTNVSQFYSEWNKAQDEVRSLGIKISEEGAYKPADRVKYQRAKLEQAGMDRASIDRYFALEQAANDIKQLSRRLNKQALSGHWFDEANEDAMRSAMDDYSVRRDNAARNGLRNAGIL